MRRKEGLGGRRCYLLVRVGEEGGVRGWARKEGLVRVGAERLRLEMIGNIM